MRAYVDGTEIDKIPELAEVCKLDDWFGGLIKWMKRNRPSTRCDLILEADSPSVKDSKILEIWIGGAPAHRAAELGGIAKRLHLDSPADGS